MRDTQAKVFDLIEKAAKDHGLEAVNDKKFANTGTLRIERPNSVTPLVNISYSFQDDYAAFSIRPTFDFGRNGNGELHAVRPDELMDRLITPLLRVIEALDPAAGITFRKA